MNGYTKNNNYNFKLPTNNITNMKQLLQYQYVGNNHGNIIQNDVKKYENSFLNEKIKNKNNLSINNKIGLNVNHSNVIPNGFNRTKSQILNSEKKLKNFEFQQQLDYPSPAHTALKTTRSISNNATLSTPKVGSIIKNEKQFNNKLLKIKNFKMTLSPTTTNNRYSDYSPNKLIPTNLELKYKNFTIYDNVKNMKDNFLIQSLNLTKTNNYILDNNKDNNFNINSPFNEIKDKKCESVLDYATKDEQNPRYRQSMEDFMKIYDKFNNDPNSGLFTLYDGHGGKDVALYAKEKFSEFFIQYLASNNPEKALILTFQKIDYDLKKRNISSENMGSTASVVYITKESDIITGTKKVAYSANVGDSRIIIIQNNGSKRISYDHRCNDVNEINRVKQAGGIIFNCRVFGQLAITRALGDHSLKKYGVIATPFTNRIVIDDRDKYIVIASDGVWDSLNDNDIFKLSLTYINTKDLANAIVKNSILKGSKDNTSCIVMRLN